MLTDKKDAINEGDILAALSTLPTNPMFNGSFMQHLAARKPIVPLKPQYKDGRRNRALEFKISGKAGETKTVSARASTPDQLYLFRGDRFLATDTAKEPGKGTIITKFKIGGQSQLPTHMKDRKDGFPTTDFLPRPLARGTSFEKLHPRAEVLFEVKFVEDCTWIAGLYGYAIPVANEGVYAITPTVPCNAKMPDIVTDTARSKPHDIRYSAAGTRCELCWFPYKAYASWPWREFKHAVEFEAIDPGESRIAVVEAANLLYASQAIMDWAPQTGRTSYEIFRTNGFALSDTSFSDEDKKFNYTLNSGIVVPRGENLLFLVRNVSAERQSFKGTIEAMEMVN